jgi:hypothetical protein
MHVSDLYLNSNSELAAVAAIQQFLQDVLSLTSKMSQSIYHYMLTYIF